MQSAHPAMSRENYVPNDQMYEQPSWSTYNPGPSQPQDDPMEFLYTSIGMSHIPESQQEPEIMEDSTPSPPNLRTNPRPTDPLSYPSDYIYRQPTRKQPRKGGR
jgi:hypothetical protein